MAATRRIRWRRLCCGLLLLGMLAVLADRLFPPDMTRLADASPILLAADGGPLSVLPAKDGRFRLATRPDMVDPAYLALLIAAEDKRFHAHWGVDPLAMIRAVAALAATGRVSSGGSTITMQVARLLEPRPRTPGAKLRQMVRALQLEARHSKEEILAMYLTLAPFGGPVEGVRMAALAYFGQEPGRLSPGQAALLAALPRSPERLRPDRHPEAAGLARRRLTERLERRGLMDPVLAEAARAEPIPAFRRTFREAPHLARHLAARGEARTTLDHSLQTGLEGLARRETLWLGDGGVAILVADIATRRVLAWVGSGGIDLPQGHVDMARWPRSPGSALKPFIYAMGFDRNLIHPETVIDDSPVRFGAYLPRNFDRGYEGRVTARHALAASLNMPAVAVLDRLGAERFHAAMETAGIRLRLPGGPEAGVGLALALGGTGVTLADLVTGYAALARDGAVRPLSVLAGVPPGPARHLVGAGAAASVTAILAEAPRPPGLALQGHDRRRISFKTGTSYGFRDAWAIGWTERHVVGVWVGRADGSPRPGATGRTAAAPILFRVFDRLDGGAAEPENAGLDPEPGPMRPPAPPALARLAPAGAEILPRPRILFPVANGIVDLGPATGMSRPPVPLEAAGGSPPYRWYVDGVLLAAEPSARPASWRPGGEGFVRVTVVDAQGRSDSRQTRILFGGAR